MILKETLVILVWKGGKLKYFHEIKSAEQRLKTEWVFLFKELKIYWLYTSKSDSVLPAGGWWIASLWLGIGRLKLEQNLHASQLLLQ